MKIENTKLNLGSATQVADGTWYALATWDNKHRDYREDAALGIYDSADEAAAAKKMGTRLVRYTIHQGAVTTRRGLA